MTCYIFGEESSSGKTQRYFIKMKLLVLLLAVAFQQVYSQGNIFSSRDVSFRELSLLTTLVSTLVSRSIFRNY